MNTWPFNISPKSEENSSRCFPDVFYVWVKPENMESPVGYSHHVIRINEEKLKNCPKAVLIEDRLYARNGRETKEAVYGQGMVKFTYKMVKRLAQKMSRERLRERLSLRYKEFKQFENADEPAYAPDIDARVREDDN